MVLMVLYNYSFSIILQFESPVTNTFYHKNHMRPTLGNVFILFRFFFQPSSYTLLFLHHLYRKKDQRSQYHFLCLFNPQQGRFLHNIPWCCRFEYDWIGLRVDRNGTSFECKQYAWRCDWFTIGTCKKREESYTGQLFDKWQCAPFVPNLIWFM